MQKHYTLSKEVDMLGEDDLLFQYALANILYDILLQTISIQNM